MGYEMRIFLRNALGHRGNTEILFKYLGFRSEVRIHHEGKPIESALVEKRDRFVAALVTLGDFDYKPTSLGINPNIEINFELNDIHWEIAKEEIIRGSLELLKDTSWDIALIRRDASPLYVRRSGKLFINSRYADDTDLTAERLASIELPYTPEVLPEL